MTPDPNTSQEAKRQAQEELDDAGSTNFTSQRFSGRSTGDYADENEEEGQIESGRVLGGYKAALKVKCQGLKVSGHCGKSNSELTWCFSLRVWRQWWSRMMTPVW